MAAIVEPEAPNYGYDNQITKIVLTVAPEFLEKAHKACDNIGVQIVTDQRVLEPIRESLEDEQALNQKTKLGYKRRQLFGQF